MLTESMDFKRLVVKRLGNEKILDVCKELAFAPSTVYGWIKQVEKADEILKAKTEKKIKKQEKKSKTKAQGVNVLKRKKRKNPTKITQLHALEDIQKGLTVEQVSSRFNVGRNTLRKWASKAGIEISQGAILTTVSASKEPLIVQITKKEESVNDVRRQLMVVLRQRDFYKKQMERLMQDSLQALEIF